MEKGNRVGGFCPPVCLFNPMPCHPERSEGSGNTAKGCKRKGAIEIQPLRACMPT